MFAAAYMLAATSALPAAGSLDVKIGYLGRGERTETISLLEQPAANNGIAGAQLAIEDNNTTGKFLNQSFSLEATRLKDGDDPVAAVTQLADRGISLIIIDLPAECCSRWPTPDARAVCFSSMSARSTTGCAQEDCRPDVIHVAPSRSMLADGLAQYLVVEAMAAMAARRRFARSGQALCRRVAAGGRAVRRQDRAGARVRGYRRRAAHRQRPRADPEPDTAVHAVGARLRRVGRCRRKSGVRVLSSVPDP